MNRWKTSLLSVSTLFLLAACTNDTSEDPTSEVNPQTEDIIEEAESSSENGQGDGHQMVHDESGDIPDGMIPAVKSTYFKDDSVILTTDHMPGMDGAEAEIVEAFDTVAYSVTYEDSETDEMVEHHKWVVHEELAEADEQEEAFDVGDEVTIEAYHMPGMKGQTAVIEEALDTTIYMVDYHPTDGGEVIRNHKWVTEEEVEPGYKVKGHE